MISYTNNKTKLNATTLIVLLFVVLIFLSSFYSNSKALKPIGIVSMSAAIFAAFNFLIFRYSLIKTMHKTQFTILLVSLAYLLLMVTGILIYPSPRSYIVIFQFFAVITFFMSCCLIKWDDYKINIMKRMALLFIVILPFVSDLTFIGAHITFALFFVLLQRKKSLTNILLFIAAIVIIYLSEARANLLLLFSAAVTYMIWNFISRTRLRFTFFFCVLVFGVLSFAFIYPNLTYWSHFQKLNYLVYTYTGQQLMSGREIIWTVLTDLISQKPILGYGTGILPQNLTTITVSSHNLYVQTALQNGLVGLGMILILFFVIWRSFFNSKNEYTTRLSASFFVGILVYQSFEVVLTQNNINTALMFWLIMSIGVSNSLYKEKVKPE